MPNVNRLKMTVGLESTDGVAVARAYAIPIMGNPGLDVEIQRDRDPAIFGENMASGFYTTRIAAGGSVSISMRPSPGVLLMLSSLFGAPVVSQGTQIAGCMRLRYTGTETSAKIMANTSADTLTSEIGTYGAESGDAAFGTAGVIDLTNASFDTLAELVAAIDAYATYECEKVFGAAAVDTGDIIDIVAEQGKDRWVYVFFSGTGTGAYLYDLGVDLSDTERDTLTGQVDERPSNEVYRGMLINSMSLSAALQGFVSCDVGILAFDEVHDITLSADTVSGDATLTNVDTRKLIPGMTVVGAGIPASTTISSITGTPEEFGSLEMSANASASATVSLAFAVPDSNVTLESMDPLVFWKGSTTYGNREYPFVNNIKVDLTNNSREDTYGQGKPTRQYHQKGMFEMSGTLQVPLDAYAYAHRVSLFGETPDDIGIVGLSFWFQGKTIYAAGAIKEMILFEAPYATLTALPRPENAEQLDAEFNWQALAPKGGYYGYPARIRCICSVNMT